MKLFVSILSIFILFSFQAQAFWGDDEKQNACYNWNGEREPCGRNSLRRESQLAVLGTSYYGDRTASLTGSYGAGFILSSVKSYDTVRFLFGGQGLYSGANTYINDTAYATTMMALDILLGVSIKPYKDTTIQPVFEIDLMGGFKSIELASPPSGVDTKNLVPSYGGKVSLGIDFKFWRFHALRPAIEYQINRVSGVIDGQSLNLDSLGFSLGLVFL